MFLKIFLFLIIFSFLHFSYDHIHIEIFKVFGGINESVFQHLKMAFWSYFFASSIEYLYKKKEGLGFRDFIIPRLFSATLVPWFIFLSWYLIPAIFGKIPILLLDILWDVIVSVFSGFSVVVLERSLDGKKLSRSFVIITLTLFALSIILYTRFTYKLPWIDVFKIHWKCDFLKVLDFSYI